MNRELLIYGAGGAGRELAFSLSLDRDSKRAWIVKGFIDDTPGMQGKIINDVEVLGNREFLKDYHGNIAVCIVSDPKLKVKIIENIKQISKVTFPIIISSLSIVSPYAELGEGCIVSLPHNFISPNVKCGKHVFVNSGTRIGHDSVIGDYMTIYSGIDIGGYVNIGPCCVIGSGVTILPKVQIGAGTIIGGGSLVSKNVPAGVVAAGVPAKVLREAG